MNTIDSILKTLDQHSIWSLMSIAEDEIHQFMRRYPDKQAQVWDAFKTVMPTENMSELHRELYRDHCQELLTRVVHEENLQPGTRAEVLTLLATISKRAPLHQSAHNTYLRLFIDIFSWNQRLITELGNPHIDPWQRANSEALERIMRQKIGDQSEKRHIPDPKRWYRLPETRRQYLLENGNM